MMLGRIVGRVVATAKDQALTGHRLLLLQPIDPDGTDRGEPLVAVDAVGAGAGERVLWVKSKEASFPFLPANAPADACVTGIVDAISGKETT